MDLTGLIIPIIFGLALPFLGGRAASRIGLPRYLVRLILLPGAFALGLAVVDFTSGNTLLRAFGPSILAFIVAGLVGYGLAQLFQQRR